MISIPLILQLFVLINPLSSFPVLVSAFKKKMDVKKIALMSTLVAFAIAIAVVFVGPLLFTMFGVGIDSLMIAGGVILLLLGIDTVRQDGETGGNVNEVDGFISLIATPLLTGPATISFIILKAYEMGQMDLVVDITITFAAIGALFVLFAFMVPKINAKVVGILSKIFGLFLTAIGIEMVATGIRAIMLVP
jgi:multiple antibiotic resistance protein